MGVQRTHRWPNRDVAFYCIAHALWKKMKRGERAVILWKTRFVLECVGAQHRQIIFSPAEAMRLDQC